MNNIPTQDIRFFVNQETGNASSYVVNGNIQMAIYHGNDVTRFAGIAKTKYFFRPMVPAEEVDLLVRGFNNRTRERNYFKLYCQLLSREITEEDFDREIEEHENLYVVEAPENAEPEEVCSAICLTERLIGIETTDDFTSVFGIDDKSIENYVKLIGDE